MVQLGLDGVAIEDGEVIQSNSVAKAIIGPVCGPCLKSLNRQTGLGFPLYRFLLHARGGFKKKITFVIFILNTFFSFCH